MVLEKMSGFFSFWSRYWIREDAWSWRLLAFRNSSATEIYLVSDLNNQKSPSWPRPSSLANNFGTLNVFNYEDGSVKNNIQIWDIIAVRGTEKNGY